MRVAALPAARETLSDTAVRSWENRRIPIMDSNEPRRIVREMAAAWNNRDLDGYLDYLHEDVTWDDPAMSSAAVGKQAVRAFSESVLRAFPDFHYEIRPPICVAPEVTRCAVPWRIRATHSKPLSPPGFGPTMRTAVFEGVDLIEFEDSLVIRIDTFFNVLVAGEQLLGIQLRPDPGSPRERLIVAAQRMCAWVTRRFRSP